MKGSTLTFWGIRVLKIFEKKEDCLKGTVQQKKFIPKNGHTGYIDFHKCQWPKREGGLGNAIKYT